MRRHPLPHRHRTSYGHSARHIGGLTLLECVIAMVILSVVTLALMYTVSAGHQHLDHADDELRAVRLAEHLLEEIQSRPYHGSGDDRKTWHVGDYDGFEEEHGNLRDFAGTLYDAAHQAYARTVSVSPGSYTLADLDSLALSGKTVVVTVSAVDGREWRLSRFLAEPFTP